MELRASRDLIAFFCPYISCQGIASAAVLMSLSLLLKIETRFCEQP